MSSVTAKPNTASLNVMRKLGMEYQGVTEHYYGAELACYHLTREQYLAVPRP